MRVTAAIFLVPLLGASASWAQGARMVSVTIDGQTVRLEMRFYQPAAAGDAPTLVFNHGSTGRGSDPRSFTRPIDYPEVAQVFVERGWAVVMPARRGRGGSEGHYDEGFAPNRSLGYACDLPYSLPGAERALRDIEAAMDAILAFPFVDPTRVVIAGQSRGGILSVAYPLSHSRESFAAFQRAGGVGTFHELPPGAGGHYLWRQPSGWVAFVEAYLKRQRLPTKSREAAAQLMTRPPITRMTSPVM